MLLDTQVYRAGRHNSPCIMYKLLTSSAPRLCTVFASLISAQILSRWHSAALPSSYHFNLRPRCSCVPRMLVAAMIWLEKGVQGKTTGTSAFLEGRLKGFGELFL
jgi:hypothetical protein